MSKTIILAGNPNVGKSSVFNTLTGLNQHTGNWTGKTVDIAFGEYNYEGVSYKIYDLPGTYSLKAHSKEEDIAAKFIMNTIHEVVVVVCDATSLERNLNLVLQIMQITPKVILCLNLMDEAKKKGIVINIPRLKKMLKVPVVVTSAKKNYGFEDLKKEIANYKWERGINYKSEDINDISFLIAKQVLIYQRKDFDKRERKIDKLLTHKFFGLGIMFLIFMIIFWITISGANYPSNLLFKMFNNIGGYLNEFLLKIHLNKTLIDLIVNGIYKVLTWVISVMLPPMAIFFPLFTLLEDLGYLPRIAFCLDSCFNKCGVCGKQALTMCMGFGCNAVGVTGARVIDSKRERIIAILTNCFVPCNGRFPTIIAIISIFMVGNGLVSAFILSLFIILAIIVTLVVSKILSISLLKGEKSSFTIELPPFRVPKIGSLIGHSILDKTVHILGRAIGCSVIAGIIIWVLVNNNVNGIPLINYMANGLDGFGKLLGLDGVIVLGFMLGLPANEIVMPIILMIYSASGSLVEVGNSSVLKSILVSNGWTFITGINFIIMSLFHFPCATTLMTIKKETGSLKWVIFSIIIPLVVGVVLCLVVNNLYHLVG